MIVKGPAGWHHAKRSLILGIIIVIGILLRLTYALFIRPLPISDPSVYIHAAESLLNEPTGFSRSWYLLWPNGYSGLLGLLGSLLGVRTIPYVEIAVLNLFFGALEMLMVFRAVALLTHRSDLSLSATFITAINPTFIIYSSTAFTEPACSALSSLLICLLLSILAGRGRRLRDLISFSLIAAIAFNYNARMIAFLLVPPMLFFVILDWRKASRATLILVSCYFLIATPKMALVYHNEGKLPLGSLLGGVNLYIGNSAYANGSYHPKMSDPIWRQHVKTRAIMPYESNLYLLKAARKNIMQRPLRFVKLIPQRLKALISNEKMPLLNPVFVHTERIDSFLPPVARESAYQRAVAIGNVCLRIFKWLVVTLGMAAMIMMSIVTGKVLWQGIAGLTRIRKMAHFLIIPAILLINLAVVMVMFGQARFFYMFYTHLTILILTAPVFLREMNAQAVSRFRLPAIHSQPVEVNFVIILTLAGWVWLIAHYMRMAL